MNLPTIPQALSVAATAFVGAAEGYVVANMGTGLPDAQHWKAIAAGAVLAGLAAVVHLYIPAPAAAVKS